MHDIWGLCPDCERWFRCERWFDRDAPQPVCDHCGVEPVAIHNRAAPLLLPDLEAPGAVT